MVADPPAHPLLNQPGVPRMQTCPLICEPDTEYPKRPAAGPKQAELDEETSDIRVI